ncbi:putative quinol monooxygenase [Thalassoporum mexicanum]|uniref:putative quinol monooxygenase n=1 Tax=Thalassoporum mexicanum TaxID=3457544 RepID=UPI0003182FFF|nr:putative quinol monooxygenase [Pseudanabaena sp. PCC 7367]
MNYKSISPIRKVCDRRRRILAAGLAIASSFGIGLNVAKIANAEVIAQAQSNQKIKQVEKTNFSGLLVILAARFKIKPEKREDFLALAEEAIARTQEEPGVISYNLFEDPNEPNSFIFFEQWKSRKSLDVHLEADYTARLLARFGDFVDSEPSTKVYRVQSIDFVLD